MPYFEKEIRLERLKWFIHLRWVAVGGGVLILFIGPWIVPIQVDYGKLLFCVVLLGILNGAYFFYWSKVESREWTSVILEEKARRLFHTQMILDLLLLTVMIFLTGGVENPIFLFYLFHLSISVMIFSIKDSFFYALPALGLPWILYFTESLNPSSQSFWPNPLLFLKDYKIMILSVYSLTVMGLWFFLSRLASDIHSKESKLFEATEALRTANEKLRQLSVYKNQFIQQVFHQLKTPVIEMDFDLSNIATSLRKSGEKKREDLQQAQRRIWVLLGLIDDLMWLSKMEVEHIPFHKEWINVYETVVKKIQAIEKGSAEKGVNFKIHGDANIRLLADRDGFERVVADLLSNAVKYTPVGYHFVVVEILLEESWLLVAVDDEGIGIPRKQQEKLFREFFRATNAKTMEKFGTGLGLTIVKRILDWHGGKIQVHSRWKEGTRVETRWPHAANNPHLIESVKLKKSSLEDRE